MSKLNLQPCWTCKKCYGDCNWSKKDPEPVPGWDATPTEKKKCAGKKDEIMHSFAIHRCPEYEWDGTVVGVGM